MNGRYCTINFLTLVVCGPLCGAGTAQQKTVPKQVAAAMQIATRSVVDPSLAVSQGIARPPLVKQKTDAVAPLATGTKQLSYLLMRNHLMEEAALETSAIWWDLVKIDPCPTFSRAAFLHKELLRQEQQWIAVQRVVQKILAVS